MANIKKIFLSSVSRGLESHRESLFAALSRVEWIKVVRMEDFGARNQASLGTCLGSIEGCDAFLAVAGPRYGSIEPESNKSFSELEYLRAKEQQIPIFAFLTESTFRLDQGLIEADRHRDNQKRFRDLLERDRQVAYFSTPGDLVGLAMGAIMNDPLFGGHAATSPNVSTTPSPAGWPIKGQEQRLQSDREPSDSPAILMFQFVTNQAGFDTGIVVTNASAGPFFDKPHAGKCRISYFGFTAGGGRAPSPQITGLVAPGAQLVFTVSNGGNLGVVATPGFQGYVVIECGFDPCYGWTFICDLGASRVASSYLAQRVNKSADFNPDWARGTPLPPHLI